MRPPITLLIALLLTLSPLTEFSSIQGSLNRTGGLNRSWQPTPPPLQQLSDFNSCVIVSQPNRNAYSFYNACAERIYINVCTRDIFGGTKLYRSGNRIQVGGRYTIFTFYEVRPQNVAWSADPFNPLLPPPCDQPQSDKNTRKT